MGWFGKARATQKSLIDFDSLQRIASDLTKLEINTIVKPDMLAKKMPEAPAAILEVLCEYRDWLAARHLVTRTAWKEDFDRAKALVSDETASRQAETVGSLTAIGLRLTKQLSEVAEGTSSDRERMTALAKEGDDVILLRIGEAAQTLDRLIGRYGKSWSAERGLPPGVLSPNDAVALRKIWEIGVQSIKMQTIIQLDGDVITYVQQSVLDKRTESILKIHAESVDISMQSWRFLVETVGQMASRLINIVVPARIP